MGTGFGIPSVAGATVGRGAVDGGAVVLVGPVVLVDFVDEASTAVVVVVVVVAWAGAFRRVIVGAERS